MVGSMAFLEKWKVFSYRTAEGTAKRLRGELTPKEWENYVHHKLKKDISPGPDGFQTDLIKTLSPTGLEIIRTWANQVLTLGPQPRRITLEQLNGTISLLHKGTGSTDRTSDWRPVVLLNTINHCVAHIINERLTNILETSGIFESGQAGFRAFRSTDSNMCKMNRITSLAQQRKTRFFRADVDWKNAFNSMSQPALWAMMRMLHIPDVDFLEELYEFSTVRLAPNGEREATIRFQTGVAQGSPLSPTLFLIFINTLARLLTEVGRAENIEHGLDGVPGFNNIFFADDMSLFAQTEQGLQRLLDITQDFETWSGIKLNLKKTVMMPVGSSKSRRNDVGAVFYRGRRVPVLPDDTPCRYLGFYATANGDFKDTKDRILQRTKELVESIRHHPFTPEIAVEIFVSQAVGLFRYSAAIVDWSQQELRDLQVQWAKGYRTAWHLKEQVTPAPFLMAAEFGCFNLPTPKEVMAATIGAHIERSLLHDDTTRTCMLGMLEDAKMYCACLTFQDMREEMSLWDWNQARPNMWLRFAKCVQELEMEVEISSLREPTEDDSSWSWAKATRQLRAALQRIQETSSSVAAWQAHWPKEKSSTWSLECQQWTEALTGMRSFWPTVRALMQAGIRSPALLEGIPGTRRIPKCLTAREDTDGIQLFSLILPRGMKGVTEAQRRSLQAFLELVDWKGTCAPIGPRRNRRSGCVQAQIKSCSICAQPCWQSEGHCHSCSRSTRIRDTVTWLDRKSRTTTLRPGEPPSVGDVTEAFISQMAAWAQDPTQTSISQLQWDTWSWCPGRVLAGLFKLIWQELDRSPEQTRFSGPSLFRKLLDTVVSKFIPLLHPLRAKRWKPLLTDSVEEGSSSTLERDRGGESLPSAATDWKEQSLERLRHANEVCLDCQTKRPIICTVCRFPSCSWCSDHEVCPSCDHPISQMDQKLRAKAGKRSLGMVVARNLHNMGRAFVERVIDCRLKTDVPSDTQPVDSIEFLARLTGWEAHGRQSRIRDLLNLQSDRALLDRMLDPQNVILIFFPAAQFPDEHPGFGDKGWWYRAAEACWIRKCRRCRLNHPLGDFNRKEDICTKCRPKTRRKRHKRFQNSESDEEWMDVEGSSLPDKTLGLRCTTADPRYAGRGDDPSGGDIIVDMPGLRYLLHQGEQLAQEEMEVWLTSAQMGFAVQQQEDEIVDHWDEKRGGSTCRCLAPQISEFIRREMTATSDTLFAEHGTDKPSQATLQDLEDTWGMVADSPLPSSPPTATPKKSWEPHSISMAAFDPPKLMEAELPIEFGENWLLNQPIPRPTSGKGYVRVVPKSVTWVDHTPSYSVMLKEGLASSLQIPVAFTIMSTRWNFLKCQARWCSNMDSLVTTLCAEATLQTTWDQLGEHSLTWRLIRSLQGVFEADSLIGGSMVTAPPFFEAAKRGSTYFWGTQVGPAVILWDAMSETERQEWLSSDALRTDWILICKREQSTKMDTTLPPGQILLSLAAQDKGKGQGRAVKRKGWWRAASIEACLNPVDMECRIHAQCVGAHIPRDKLRMIQRGWFCRLKKDECQVRLDEREQHYWLGTEAGALGAYGFRGAVVGCDGSDTQGRMGAGYSSLQRQLPGAFWERLPEEEVPSGEEIFDADLARCMKSNYSATPAQIRRVSAMGLSAEDFIQVGKHRYRPKLHVVKGCLRVGRAEEGTSSLRPELAALQEALAQLPVSLDALLLIDCQSVLTEIGKWIGEGCRASLAKSADSDILRSILPILHARIQAGAATFLLKVKAHRGEPLNESADDEAARGTQLPAETMRWNDRTARLIYSWKSTAGISRRAPFQKSVRLAFRQKGGLLAYHEAMQAGRKKWAQDNWHGPWLNGKSVQTSSVQTLQSSWWLPPHERDEMLTDINRQARGPPGRGRGHTPATSSWAMDFLTRKGESRKSIHDWLRDRKIPWQRRRRLIQVMANCFPTGSYLALIGQRNSAHCELCQRLRPDVPIHQLPRETLGHIQSAWCVAQGDVVREAHNNCVNRIVRDFQSPEISSIGLTILTAEGEKTMQSLWTMDPFAQMGTWEQFVEATWSARCFRLHIDGTKLEAETSSLGCKKCSDPCHGIPTHPGLSKEKMECCLCKGSGRQRMEDPEICQLCWQRALLRRRFDMVAVNQGKKSLFLIEFKRTSDLDPRYREEASGRAERQYMDEIEGIRAVLPKDWKVTQVSIIAGSTSINETAWNAAMKALGIPAKRWKAFREHLMYTLLNEHDKVLRSYWAQRFGSTQSSIVVASQAAAISGVVV